MEKAETVLMSAQTTHTHCMPEAAVRNIGHVAAMSSGRCKQQAVCEDFMALWILQGPYFQVWVPTLRPRTRQKVCLP